MFEITNNNMVRRAKFRGKYRLLNALLPRTGVRAWDLFGFQMTLDIGEHISRNIYCGTYELRETELVRSYLKPGMTVVDVGANVGYYTALAASIVGSSGRVYAVEPANDNFSCLSDFVSKNGLHSVYCSQIALGDVTGAMPLYAGPRAVNRTASMVPSEGATVLEVPVRRLDDCLEEWGVHAVDLLKIDTDGWEGKVLQGAANALAAKRIRAVLCEFSHWQTKAGSAPEEVYERLMSAGFVDVEGPLVFRPGVAVNRFMVLR